MNIITYENFKPENIVLSLENKKYLYTNETYQFKKVIPKYIYDNGKEDDIYIQIPEVHSFGIKTFVNKDQPSSQPSHSFSFSINVKPNIEEGIDEEKAKIMTEGIIKIFDDISHKIKEFLKTDSVVKKLGKTNKSKDPREAKAGWIAIVDSLKPFMSYQIDKETDQIIEGSSPTMFVKLKTETKNPGIKTTFKQYNCETGNLDDIPPNTAPDTYQGCRCTATGVVHIESIYLPKMPAVSIQYKLYDVLITEILKMNVNRLIIPNRFNNQAVEKIYDSDSESDDKFKSFTEEAKSVSRN
jgi:hypothetical protein